MHGCAPKTAAELLWQHAPDLGFSDLDLIPQAATPPWRGQCTTAAPTFGSMTSAAPRATDHIEMVMAGRGLSVENVLLYAVPDLDGVNVIRWTATDVDSELVRGMVAVQVQQDVHELSVKLVVSVLSGTTGRKARA